MQDALACLASEEIKLASLKNKADEDEGVTEEDMRGALVAAAKKTIISQVRYVDLCDATEFRFTAFLMSFEMALKLKFIQQDCFEIKREPYLRV